MKAFKKVLLVVGVIILIAVIISLFLPSQVRVERSIYIKTQKCMVFDQIGDFRNWYAWSPWHSIDSAMISTYEGPETGEGSIYKWESKNHDVGKGMMKVLKMVRDSQLVIELVMGKDRMSETVFLIENLTDSLKVTWSITSNLGWNPVSKFFGLAFDGMVGPDFEKGLENLKALCETKPCCSRYKVEEVDAIPTNYLSIRDTCTMMTIGPKMDAFAKEIMAFMKKSGVQQKGAPLALYYSFENGIFDMETAFPVDKVVKPAGKIKNGEIKAGKALMVQYFGNYDKMEKAHQTLQQYIQDHAKKVTGPCWEEYITDPMSEPDTSKWLTRIYYPVE